MGSGTRYGDADVAAFAMVEVFTQTFTSPANATIRTMVDFLFAVVVPQFADVTVVTSSFCLAIAAVISCLLRCSAYHAEHVLCPLSVEIVFFYSIMAMPTCVPMLAFVALHLYIALVMLATEGEFSFDMVVVLILAMVCAAMLRLGPMCRIGVAGSQTEWILGINFRGS